jgi:hypothetical protein
MQGMITGKVICLCGPLRYRSRLELTELLLSIQQNIVLPPVFRPEGVEWFPSMMQRQLLKEVHLTKVDLCSLVLVVDTAGRIGEDTKAEIEYAKSKGKMVLFLSQCHIKKNDLVDEVHYPICATVPG